MAFAAHLRVCVFVSLCVSACVSVCLCVCVCVCRHFPIFYQQTERRPALPCGSGGVFFHRFSCFVLVCGSHRACVCACARVRVCVRARVLLVLFWHFCFGRNEVCACYCCSVVRVGDGAGTGMHRVVVISRGSVLCALCRRQPGASLWRCLLAPQEGAWRVS